MKHTTAPSSANLLSAQVHIIEPNGVYFPEDVRLLLRLNNDTIRREVRLGRLRVSKRGKRYRFLGAWLLEWIAGGELGKVSPRPVKEDA